MIWQLAHDARNTERVRGLLAGETFRDDLQCTNREIAHSARETSATANPNWIANRVDADPARQEQFHRLRRARREDAGVLEEEGTLLGEEERETREVGALFVYFYLSEVGVVGEVERKTRRDAKLRVGTELARTLVTCIDGPITMR